MAKATALDRVIGWISPSAGLARIRSRAAMNVVARHYEAASLGRRTQNWGKNSTDANTAALGALAPLRFLARDLTRNNAWARNGKRVITRNVIGWGIVPKPVGGNAAAAAELWKKWADTTQCDARGRLTFAGIQKLCMSTIVESGEVLVRRRWRRPEDGFAIPMQYQVLEPDHIDTAKDHFIGQQGGPVIQGVEFDAIGRRVAYWLFDQHPGSGLTGGVGSRRIPETEVIHVFDVERAGQERGPSWLGAAITSLKDFDDFEDAELMRQKIAACFAGFVTDYEGDGGGPTLGEANPDDPAVETLEPGMIQKLPPGKQITFANPPTTTDTGFSVRTLRRIAAAIGVTYEDLTGDYSNVNFSSARMARLAHWANVYDWQWNMVVPQLCAPLWAWAMDAAVLGGGLEVGAAPSAEWTPQPMPMIEPDREAIANLRMMRSGQKTLFQVLREQGVDPETHVAEIAKVNAALDAAGIVLDSDPRKVTQAGLAQASEQSGGGGSP